MNPENGGMPERLSAGMKKMIVITGESTMRPPSDLVEVDPPRISTSPMARNSAVWTMMWWTV